MISKYFILTFICFSLAQVQGNEVQNAIRKGLIKMDALYDRGITRIDSIDGNQSQHIQTIAATFMENIQKMQENGRQNLREGAQTAEEKAQEIQKPDSALECISEAEMNANDQIQTFTNAFRVDVEGLQKMCLITVQLTFRSLETYRQELKSRYDKTIPYIKACKTTQCAEMAVNNYYTYLENVSEAVRKIRTQINTAINNFQREGTTSFNNVNRQVRGVQSAGLREFRECVYRRNVFEKEQ